MELFFKLYLTTKHNKYQLINLYNYFLISLFFYRIFQVINGLTNAKKVINKKKQPSILK